MEQQFLSKNPTRKKRTQEKGKLIPLDFSAEAIYRYCSVCRQNHQQGKGHKYSTKHKQRLTQLLSKAHKRIQEIRVFLLNNNNVSSRLQPPQEDHQQQRKFWCHFCEQEVVEEKHISFMWGDVIQHLASAEHVAAVKAFWSEHGADVAKRHLYVLSEEDLEKWKEACEVPIAAAAAGEVRNNGKERVETNNIHSNMAHFSEGHLFKLESRQSVSLVASVGTVQPLSVLTLGSLQNHGSTGTGNFCAATVHEHQPQSSMLASFVSLFLADLTSISCPPAQAGEGNVHSGATPPWLKSTDYGQGSSANTNKTLLSSTQERRLARMRPPNRVGAAWAEQRRIEIEREERGKETNDSVDQQDGAMWLPNFGRVWQSGPRGATLKEFKSERRKEAKSLGRPLVKRRATGSDGM
ncbi:unnamed protein product, partial [Sphagnum balticum]